MDDQREADAKWAETDALKYDKAAAGWESPTYNRPETAVLSREGATVLRRLASYAREEPPEARDGWRTMPDILTEADVRRIAREEATEALARLLAGSQPTQPDPPPAQPAAKRVEAWGWLGETGLVNTAPLDYPIPMGAVYLTHFPGVHDAASAERMMAAMRQAVTMLRRCGCAGTADNLAEFLDPPR